MGKYTAKMFLGEIVAELLAFSLNVRATKPKKIIERVYESFVTFEDGKKFHVQVTELEMRPK